jgi:hypothetical protein
LLLVKRPFLFPFFFFFKKNKKKGMKNWCSMTVFDKKKKKKKKKTLRDTTRFAFRETHFNLLIRFLFGRPGAVKVSNWYFLGEKKKKKKDTLSSKSYTLT